MRLTRAVTGSFSSRVTGEPALGCQIPQMLSHALSRRRFSSPRMLRLPAKSLISMVGAHGLEPWTR
jgi:hypothetical protein